jgi:hypothetical protein
VGAVRVRFFLHGVQLGSRVTQPLHWSWDTTTTGKGTHSLCIAAPDTVGKT